MKKLVFLIIVFISTFIYSQELNCTVTVNYESLPVLNRELLSDFHNIVQDYMNKTRFTGSNWEGGKIVCKMDIFFTSASSEVDYSAQVFIYSQRPIYNSTDNSPMLTVLDPTWSFRYERGQALYANQSTFDPLTSFLDYYANIIIAYDLDSWEQLGGNKYYSEAADIVNLGASSKFNKGWLTTSSSYSRRGLVDNALNDKYRPFREAFFDYHYNGIDIYSQDKDLAQKNIANLVRTLKQMENNIDFNSVILKVFFDAKNGEIVDYLSDYAQKDQIFAMLKKLDPSHISKYNDAMD